MGRNLHIFFRGGEGYCQQARMAGASSRIPVNFTVVIAGNLPSGGTGVCSSIPSNSSAAVGCQRVAIIGEYCNGTAGIERIQGFSAHISAGWCHRLTLPGVHGQPVIFTVKRDRYRGAAG